MSYYQHFSKQTKKITPNHLYRFAQPKNTAYLLHPMLTQPDEKQTQHRHSRKAHLPWNKLFRCLEAFGPIIRQCWFNTVPSVQLHPKSKFAVSVLAATLGVYTVYIHTIHVFHIRISQHCTPFSLILVTL